MADINPLVQPTESCAGCKFWIAQRSECHLDPPEQAGVWCVTKAGDWCGKFAAGTTPAVTPVPIQLLPRTVAADRTVPPRHHYGRGGVVRYTGLSP